MTAGRRRVLWFAVPRLRHILLAAAVTVLAAAGGEVVLGSPLAAAEGREVDVGTELLAVADVTLHRAEIAKGSRVNVTQLLQHDGRVDAVNVALSDGHIVMMPLRVMHSFFRIVDE